MIVRVGKKTFKATDLPIMIIFDAQGKKNVQALKPDENIYIEYPNDIPKEIIDKWVHKGEELTKYGTKKTVRIIGRTGQE